jgi:simple sugar transport system permease protein
VSFLRRIGSAIRIPALSIFVALLVGAIFIVVTDIEVLGLLLSDPIGALSLGIGRAASAYSALARGAFGDPASFSRAFESNGDINIWARALRPIVESVVSAVPLIFVGLGVSVAFRTGIFNIGGAGQFSMGAIGGSRRSCSVPGRHPHHLRS